MKKALLFFIVFFIACSNSNGGHPTKTVAAKPSVSTPIESEKKFFNFTSDQYIKRYNEALIAIEQPMRMRKKKVTSNEENRIVQAIINKHLGMIMQERKDNGFVDYLTFIGAGDGTFKSAADLMFTLACVIMAVENPQMTRDERGDILKDLGLTDKQFPGDGEKLTFIRNGIEFTLSTSKELGIWLIAHPI